MIWLWPAMHECIAGGAWSQMLPIVQIHRYSGQEWLRRRWWSHRDQHYESGIFVSLPWMRNHHAETNVYQLLSDCKEHEDLHHVCLSRWHLGMLWSPACLFMHGFTIYIKMNANGLALFIFSLRNSHKFEVHKRSQEPFADSLASLGLGTVELYFSQVSIHTISH